MKLVFLKLTKHKPDECQGSDIEQEEQAPLKLYWVNTGNFIILPNTIYFKMWLLCKSIIYLIDLYEMSYNAGNLYEYAQDYKIFSLIVDSVNIIDIFMHFFTAVKVGELTEKAKI